MAFKHLQGNGQLIQKSRVSKGNAGFKRKGFPLPGAWPREGATLTSVHPEEWAEAGVAGGFLGTTVRNDWQALVPSSRYCVPLPSDHEGREAELVESEASWVLVPGGSCGCPEASPASFIHQWEETQEGGRHPSPTPRSPGRGQGAPECVVRVWPGAIWLGRKSCLQGEGGPSPGAWRPAARVSGTRLWSSLTPSSSRAHWETAAAAGNIWSPRRDLPESTCPAQGRHRNPRILDFLHQRQRALSLSLDVTVWILTVPQSPNVEGWVPPWCSWELGDLGEVGPWQSSGQWARPGRGLWDPATFSCSPHH